MNLTWLGTAGFIVKSKEGEIIFDPFLSRGMGETSPFTTKSFENSQALFVGHGHFDHTFDIPEISKGTDFKIFAPGLTRHILKLRGVPSHRLVHTKTSESLFKPLKVRAFHSSHVRFDMPLIVSTAKRCGIKGCLQACKLGLAYPKGLVQTYLFEAEGKKILYMSSAGANENELLVYRQLEIDYFLAPLQGHSSIQEIAARQTAIIKPKVVIPHHHDDFFPPLSQNISVDVFREKLNQMNYRGDILEIPLFKSSLI
jgi:L-ascorbate metabolism protein UlaG (beta-lactamase superfamily)